MDKIRRTTRRQWLLLATGCGAGVVITYLTGWPVMLLVAPAAIVGLPMLLSEPPQRDRRLLEALDRWVRTMLGLMSTGKSIADAIRVSARQAPEPLAAPLASLARRLDDRWAPAQALMAMADDLESPDADAVLAALILSVQRGGTGASATLRALADSIQDRLQALREIEAERSKPRAVVRQVTIITVGVLAFGLLFARDFFAPYGTPVGQLILVSLLSVYAASLFMLRKMTLPRGRDRILRPLP
ncbi:type II secretion system F family protein [Nigerium massiliense]|uniref:type II secretion system F family protein n=1 Tax=Nigerium massiliense TaxID=1522317 RepID=UPI0006949CA0|nr:type II secretion system F family protein [Nigerium massiliense]